MVSDNPPVDYSLIADAVETYQKLGFQRVEVPWSVPSRSIEITAPQGAVLYPHTTRNPVNYLVASGEQSLLEHVIQQNETAGKSPYEDGAYRGKFLAVTPCFRAENQHSDLTRPYFIKVELFDNSSPLKRTLHEIMNQCLTWYLKHIPCSLVKTNQSETDPVAIGPTYDIVSQSGIELGSYGIRNHPSVGKWIYATGCAEPRLSALKIRELGE